MKASSAKSLWAGVLMTALNAAAVNANPAPRLPVDNAVCEPGIEFQGIERFVLRDVEKSASPLMDAMYIALRAGTDWEKFRPVNDTTAAVFKLADCAPNLPGIAQRTFGFNRLEISEIRSAGTLFWSVEPLDNDPEMERFRLQDHWFRPVALIDRVLPPQATLDAASEAINRVPCTPDEQTWVMQQIQLNTYPNATGFCPGALQ